MSKTMKKLLSIILAILMIVSAIPVALAAEGNACAETDCTGTYENGFCTVCDGYQEPEQNANGYYEIANAGNLYWFTIAVETNRKINAVLTADIDLNPGYVFASDGTVTKGGVTVTEGWRHWEPIGVYGYNKGYQGGFDGNFHTVSGMYCIAEGGSKDSYLGLFSRITGGTVTELGVMNGYVYGSECLGGIAGYVDSGTISKCWNEVTVKSKSAASGFGFGGIAGSNNGVIENCYNLGLVSGRAYRLGGIVGSQNTSAAGTKLINCYNIGAVVPQGTESGYGHIVGEGGKRVSNCYYLSDSETDSISGTTAVTTTDFASGKVTYLLNQGITDGSQAWYQTCGEQTPAFFGKTVYAIFNSCYIGDNISGYTNEVTVVPTHNYNQNGFCENLRADGITACDAYQPCEKDTNGFYEISNAGQLYWFALQVNDKEELSANAVLTANIKINEDLNDADRRTWIPIGNYNLTGKKYSGTFDGKGHTIRGLYCDQGSLRGSGLFGYCDQAVLKNINVEASYFYADHNAGAIAGNVAETQVINCHSINNTIIVDILTAGGVLGACHTNSVVDRCSNTSTVTHLDNGDIEDGWRAGGIVGWAYNSVVKNCWNSGEISARRLAAGGIVGGKSYNLTIENCYNVGTVTLFDDAMSSGAYSPILGMTYDKDEPGELNIVNCYYLEATYPDSQRRDGTTEKSKDAFQSGEVAYLLNGSTSGGNLVWGQLIGTDDYPVLGGATVYYNETKGYYNILHTCDFSGEWKYNAEKHWKECSEAECEEISEEGTHSFESGVCSVCEYECPHESYTDGVCDNCEYSCPHNWDTTKSEDNLTRPNDNEKGYYTYTCSICSDTMTEEVESANYTAYDALAEKVFGYYNNENLTDEAKEEIYQECLNFIENNENITDEGLLPTTLIASEQAIVDEATAELQKVGDAIEAKIASGEYVKADYTEIDEAIAEIETALEDATISDEMKAELEDIKSDLEALKADTNASVADLANSGLVERAEAITETMNACAKGEHSFTKYTEVTAPECGKAGLEKATCDNGCGAADEREIAALEHVFGEYTSNGDATCTADGTKTAECVNGCGTEDTVTDEGTILDHVDEDGDKVCDECGGEAYERCDICGGKAHGETKFGWLFCLIITIIRFITSLIA